MTKNIVLFVRVIFGGWWLYSGLNHWFHFFEQPYGSTDVSIQFTLALETSGLLTLVKIMEVIQGILIIGGRAMPLALASALPLSIMIGYWNLVLTPGPVEIVFGILTLFINGVLMLAYWQYYRPMFIWRAEICTKPESLSN